MKKTLSQLTIAYYAVYITAILGALAGFYILRNGFSIDPQSQTGIVLSSALIILIIGSIPLALALFNRYTKKLVLLTDETEKFQKYRKAGLMRIWVIGLGLVLGIVFFYVMQSQSMIFCAGIAAIGLFFCKPAESKIISELKLEEYQD
ncbi:MAG: hypothetical protein Q7U47_12785 [Paludibacter sp.]|nr:hypothetical protein [Paludibacter sp.]